MSPKSYFMQFVFKPAASGRLTYCTVRHPFMGKRVKMTLAQWFYSGDPDAGGLPSCLRLNFNEMEATTLVGQIIEQPPSIPVPPTISDNGNGGIFLPNLFSAPAVSPNGWLAGTSFNGGGKVEFECNLTWQELTCSLYDDMTPVGDIPPDSVGTAFNFAILGFQVELLE